MRAKKQINIEIGEQVKYAREAASLTQEQFSEQIEVTPQYISDMERGVVGLSLTTLKRVCLVLGVSADQILFGEKPADRMELLAEKCSSLTEEQFDFLLTIINAYVQAIHTASDK